MAQQESHSTDVSALDLTPEADGASDHAYIPGHGLLLHHDGVGHAGGIRPGREARGLIGLERLQGAADRVEGRGGEEGARRRA